MLFKLKKSAGDRGIRVARGEEVLAFLGIAAQTAASLEITSIFP
jgi:hypothetical protein